MRRPLTRHQRVACIVGILLMTGCGRSVLVESRHDHRASFDDYHTFAMLEPDRAVPTQSEVDPFTLQRLRQLTAEELTRRGFRQTSRTEAELLVAVLAGVEARVDGSPIASGYAPAVYYGPYGGYEVYEYEEGTVIIDLIDREKDAVVWRGAGTKPLPEETSDEDLQDFVEAILAEYPPDEDD